MASALLEKYTFESPCPQQFSLPSTIMFYLQQSASGLKILYKTCKYFFFKNNLLIIQSPIFNKQTWPYPRGFCPSKLKYCKSRFWFSGSLILEKPNKYPQILDWIYPKIYECQIFSLRFDKSRLEMHEFEFLLSTKTLNEITLYKTTVFDLHGNRVPLDGIVEKIPRILWLHYWSSNEFPREIITNETFENLINQIQINKFKAFQLTRIAFAADLTPELLLKFCDKHADPNQSLFYFQLTFGTPFQREIFSQSAENYQWTIQKPDIIFNGI